MKSIVVRFGNRKRDTVIIDRKAIGRRREVSMGPTNGECDISKPFDWTKGEPLNVTNGDRECENLSVLDVQINVDHEH
jgi:hypothetical protein